MEQMHAEYPVSISDFKWVFTMCNEILNLIKTSNTLLLKN